MSPKKKARSRKIRRPAKRRKTSSVTRKRAGQRPGTGARTVAGTKVPPLMQLVNIFLTVQDADGAAEFYEKAFEFEKKFAMPGPDGKTVHAELTHGDCTVMLGPSNPETNAKAPSGLGGSPVTAYVYVKDVDGLARRAEAAGAKILFGPRDEFWGDRVCAIVDPEGHNWWFATYQRLVPPEEMRPPNS